MSLPFCFVLMPFGKKPDNGRLDIDFDSVYYDLIFPAIEEAGLKPIRADEEKVGGIIHKPMFERLILCEYAVVDFTTGNPNVFYELGVRHAARPYSTVFCMQKAENNYHLIYLHFVLFHINLIPQVNQINKQMISKRDFKTAIN